MSSFVCCRHRRGCRAEPGFRKRRTQAWVSFGQHLFAVDARALVLSCPMLQAALNEPAISDASMARKNQAPVFRIVQTMLSATAHSDEFNDFSTEERAHGLRIFTGLCESMWGGRSAPRHPQSLSLRESLIVVAWCNLFHANGIRVLCEAIPVQ